MTCNNHPFYELFGLYKTEYKIPKEVVKKYSKYSRYGDDTIDHLEDLDYKYYDIDFWSPAENLIICYPSNIKYKSCKIHHQEIVKISGTKIITCPSCFMARKNKPKNMKIIKKFKKEKPFNRFEIMDFD